jgi:hypothetical protein
MTAWNLRADRHDIYCASKSDATKIHQWLMEANFDRQLAQKMGLALRSHGPKYIRKNEKTGIPTTFIRNVRPARRIGPDGQTEADLVLEIIQTREVPYDDSDPTSTFKFRGGCTLLINRERREVRWCIVKSIFDEERLERERDYRTGASDLSLRATYFGDPRSGNVSEPFAMLHRSF